MLNAPTDDDEAWSGASDRLTRLLEHDPTLARTSDVLVTRGGSTLFEWSKDPAAEHDLFSVTKTVLALLFGVAVDRGLIRLADHSVADPRWNYAQLLSMQRPVRTDPPFDLDTVVVTSKRWAATFAEAPRSHGDERPFSYDNGSFQIVADDLHHVVVDLEDFAHEHLFRPLSIGSWTWSRDDHGVPCGAAHLALRACDLHAIGTVLNGHRTDVVSDSWLRQMCRRTSAGGPPENRSYGLGLWLEESAARFGAGWAGQLVYSDPEQDLVIVSMADPDFTYGPPASDSMPLDWRSVLDVLRDDAATQPWSFLGDVGEPSSSFVT
jgi:CubicO group peptidase (beta-lactamase class C family)